MIDVKAPRNLKRILSKNAPSRTVSENWGRNIDYYGDSDVTTAGYRSILIYIQLGLEEYEELVNEVVKLVLQVQRGINKKYPIVVSAFGRGDELIHDKKHFKMGYINDRLAGKQIANALIALSSKEECKIPAIIPKFFPKTDIRSIYGGKTAFEKDDLMVIIGKKDEVYFAKNLQDTFRSWMKKRILFIEIDNNCVNWNYRYFEMKFSII